ncbi:MAG: heavy-metal-associated domain-containing protein [Chloroflexi bacterium]|nr:heavy-metal-associated domain-containing protein [Chloroflexota bacterium]
MPVWKNLWVEPDASFAPAKGGEDNDQQVEVQVSGLLCHRLCVVRVQRALARQPGVVSATALPGEGRFLVRYRDQPELEGLRRAVLRQVVLRRLRRLLSSVGRLASG